MIKIVISLIAARVSYLFWFLSPLSPRSLNFFQEKTLILSLFLFLPLSLTLSLSLSLSLAGNAFGPCSDLCKIGRRGATCSPWPRPHLNAFLPFPRYLILHDRGRLSTKTCAECYTKSLIDYAGNRLDDIFQFLHFYEVLRGETSRVRAFVAGTGVATSCSGQDKTSHAIL